MDLARKLIQHPPDRPGWQLSAAGPVGHLPLRGVPAAALLALQGRLPASLPPGQARAALMAVIARTLGHPDSFDPGGWLRLGLNRAQPGMAETTISTGSLYLCAAAFLPPGLPPDDRFRTAPAQPWTQARVWSLGETGPPDVALEKRPLPKDP